MALDLLCKNNNQKKMTVIYIAIGACTVYVQMYILRINICFVFIYWTFSGTLPLSEQSVINTCRTWTAMQILITNSIKTTRFCLCVCKVYTDHVAVQAQYIYIVRKYEMHMYSLETRKKSSLDPRFRFVSEARINILYLPKMYVYCLGMDMNTIYCLYNHSFYFITRNIVDCS